MSDNEQKIWSAISSVMNGKPSLEEQRLFDSWLNENDGNKKFYEVLRKGSAEKMSLSKEAKERIYSRIETNVLPSKKKSQINFKIIAIAASVAFLIAMSMLGLVIKNQTSGNIAFLEATTPFGVKSKIVLSDNTSILLNGGSTLKYPAEFKGKTREVFLTGEAYFEVAKNTTHPFIVNTSKVNIKVLGTHFNVKSFPEENIFETALLEGSVVLYTPSDMEENMVKLKPNQKALFSEITGKIIVQNTNAEREASWKEDKFYFDNELLPSIVKELERCYNVPIRIYSQKLNNDAYSGFFDKNRTIYQALDIMKFNRDFYYETKNDTILIYSKDKQ